MQRPRALSADVRGETKTLEQTLHGWKMSGSHGDLEYVTPLDDLDGVTNVGILYLHQSLYEHEGLIKLCLLVLPSDVSCEMGKNRLPPRRSMKGEKSNGSGKGVVVAEEEVGEH